MITAILGLFSGLSFLTILPIIATLLAIVKSLVDIMASVASIAASAASAVSSVFVSAQPTFKAVFNILSDLIGIAWGWIKAFGSWLEANVLIIFSQWGTALTMAILVSTAVGVGRLEGISVAKGVNEAEVLAAKHEAYAKGHAEGIKEATNKRYRPNR